MSPSSASNFSDENIEFESIDSPSSASSSDEAAFKFDKHRRESAPSVKVTLSSGSADTPAERRTGSLDEKWKKQKKERKHRKHEKHKNHKKHKKDKSKSQKKKENDSVDSMESRQKKEDVDDDESKIPYLKYAIREYGNPDVTYVSKRDPLGSFARWSERTLRKAGHPELRRVEVRARGYEHSFPKSHGDHVYSTIVYEIPDDKIWDVLKLSDSLTYDRLAHELTSRCAGWQTNSAILYLACRLAAGNISLNDARDRDVLKKMMTKAAGNSKVAHRYAKKLASMIAE